jgi:hypothetical protein
MSDLFFNIDGKQHYLRIRPNLDETDHGTQVYEALIDGREYTFFEVALDGFGTVDVWSLFEAAIAAYRAEKAEAEEVE